MLCEKYKIGVPVVAAVIMRAGAEVIVQLVIAEAELLAGGGKTTAGRFGG